MEEKYTVKNQELTIYMDELAEDPRTAWDNLGTMICFHRTYMLGDKHDFNSPDDVNLKDYAVVLPLFLYDHSGITIRTAPFSCTWDSGQVGWIVIDTETIKKKYGVKRITKKLIEEVTDILMSEVKVYDDYLTGNESYTETYRSKKTGTV